MEEGERVGEVQGSGWDALGLLQFHFAELRLDAEMGGTMGQTSWITQALTTRVASDSSFCLSFQREGGTGAGDADESWGAVAGGGVQHGKL